MKDAVLNTPRRITKKLNSQYINEIIQLAKNINLNALSLLLDYQEIFEKEDIELITQSTSKIEEYLKSLKEYKNILMQGKCHSSVHIKFKKAAQEIFEIEQLLKKYSVKVWETQLTDIDNFKNGNSYCYVVYSLLMSPNLKYLNDVQLIQEQYEKRMDMLQDSKRRFLSTSLVADELTRLFYESHIAAIIQVDESNYIAANYRDAATGDSMFSKTCMSKGNYDDIYTIRRDELGNLYTGEPATIVSTPKVIKYRQLYDESAVTVNEIILDRSKSKAKGILCYIYGNEFLSYSRKFAESLGEKYNLPVSYVDKMLYTDKNISEYELYEQYEITDGIKQYLDEKTKERIYYLSERNFDIASNTYFKIFELASKESISNKEEAKIIVENIARQIIKQKEVSLGLDGER